jgi:lysophospholipase L1-like esterase
MHWDQGDAAMVTRSLASRAHIGGLLLVLLPLGIRAQGIDHSVTMSSNPTAASRHLRIVALGDSTTATARDWAPEIQEVYADCLPGALKPHGIEAIVVNAGIGDTTTRQAVARLDRDVRRHHPDLVVIQFGINDSWIDVDLGKTRARLTRAEFRRNLTAMARRLRHDGALVVLMTPNPMRWRDPFYIKAFGEHSGLLDVTAARGIDRLLDVYAQDVRDVAKTDSLPLVDVFAAFENYGNLPGHSMDDILLANDGIHPNQRGQRLVCALLTDRIAEILGVRPTPSQ